MKKWMKIVLIILGVWISIFLIDFVCVKTIKRPIFMVRTSIYKDGGTKEYLGLGYKVIKCNTLIGDKKVTIGTYFIDYNCKTKEEKEDENITLTDNVKFSKEYTSVTTENVFVYRNINEIIDILDNGTGIVYLGFPECKWCQAYVPYLNEVAKEEGIEEIYYFNIMEDRKENTKEYKKIVELLKERLQKDNEGNERVYVPNVSFHANGKLVGNNCETSLDTKGLEKPEDYWTEEEVTELKANLTKYIDRVLPHLTICTDCNK